jgi:peptidyl-prolyl cis-trans isomerase SurA
MLRSGWLRFHRPAGKFACFLLLLPFSLPLVWAAMLVCGLGCQCDDWTLVPAPAVQPAPRPAQPPAASTSASLPQGQAPPGDAPNLPPTVSRFQQPDAPSPRTPARRPVLDQVSYEVTAPNDTQVAARIRATVNAVPILDEEVRQAVYPYLVAIEHLPEPERSNKRKEVLENELKQLIERELILQDMFGRLKDRERILDKFKEAANREFDKKMRKLKEGNHIKTDEEFKAFLRAQGVSLAEFRRQFERNFLATEYMRSRIGSAIDRVSLQQIKEYYEQHPEQFQINDSVLWQDIFVDASKFPDRARARQLAEQLIARARAGEDFAKLAQQFDQGDSSYRNGEGYGHQRGEIRPPEAEPILFGMHDGDIGPILEQPNGFHIIRLVKRDYAGLKPCDDKVQKSIKNKLESEVYQREWQRIIAELKRSATVEVSASTN